jgi:FkbM family methyltransferase
MKTLIRKVLRPFGYDLKRLHQPGQTSLIEFLRSRDVDLVLDVGANCGQFAAVLRGRGYRGRIVSFEPVRAAFEVLQAAAAGDGLWEVRREAVGDVTGRAHINVSQQSIFSSFVEQTSFTKRHYAEKAAVTHTEEVGIVRLDDVFFALGGDSVFLKIDTQGFERQVLAGAGAALAEVKGVQLELPLVHSYVGVWSFTAAVDHMAELGFALSQVSPVCLSAEDTASIAELDCIFRRGTADTRPSRDAPQRPIAADGRRSLAAI